MKVSVVIPNYNGAEILKENLPKVLEILKDAEVIVADDASTDGSIEEIKYQISNIKNTYKKAKIKLFINEKNLGFSSTVNRGVDEASGELVLLLNSDVVPQSDFLDPLISHFTDSQVFAAGCLQKNDGKLQGRGIGKFERGFLIHSRGVVSDKDTSDGGRLSLRSHDSSEVEDFRKTLWVFGGAGIFRKSIWEKLGGLDTLYNPFYWEDIDISYRALKSGYKLVFEPKSIVTHSQEKGAIRSSYTEEQIKTIAYRNQILFVWQNITDASLLLQHIIYLPYHLLISIFTSDFSFIKGLMLAILKLPQVISHRLGNKRTNIVSDKEIFSEFR